MSGVAASIGIASQQKPSAVQKSERALGKDDFLKLLIAQLKQQDPLSPVQNTEFIAQMAQLTSLEQLQEVNKNISQLVALQEQMQKNEELSFAAGLLGREIEAKNPQTYEAFKELAKGYYQRDGEVWLICERSEIPLSWVYRVTLPSEAGE
ncbi:MAG: flagellar hook assembly protein FlgD [Thermacetogeniaceae bacterium]